MHYCKWYNLYESCYQSGKMALITSTLDSIPITINKFKPYLTDICQGISQICRCILPIPGNTVWLDDIKRFIFIHVCNTVYLTSCYFSIIILQWHTQVTVATDTLLVRDPFYGQCGQTGIDIALCCHCTLCYILKCFLKFEDICLLTKYYYEKNKQRIHKYVNK